MSNTPQIHTWFPRAIFLADNVMQSKLLEYEEKIREIVVTTGTQGNDFLAVHSTHKTSPDLHKHPFFQDLVTEIIHHASGFVARLGYSSKYFENLQIDTMWTNISYEGSYIFPHIHPASFISGVYYVKKFPDSKISFFKDYSMLPTPEVFNDLSYEYCMYDCDPGRLLMWKSDFLHGTGRQPEGEKIAISFNITVKRND
jgi:uncharacterized protein (TIGR02466 family)